MERVLVLKFDLPYEPQKDDENMEIVVDAINKALKKVVEVEPEALPIDYENYCKLKRLMEG